MDAKKRAARRLWVKIHLVLGVGAGALFALIGLSGSVLAIEPVFRAALAPRALAAAR